MITRGEGRGEKNELRLWEKLANFLFNPNDSNLGDVLALLRFQSLLIESRGGRSPR